MNSVVLKFSLPERGVTSISLPHEARILSVADQCGAPQLWALVDRSTANWGMRTIGVFYTGHDEVPEDATFIGTVLSSGGNIVRHIFELTSK